MSVTPAEMQNLFGNPPQFGTAALSSTTASAGQLTPTGGIGTVYMTNTGATPGSYTTRTAAQMIADAGLSPGATYAVWLCNFQATGTLTLVAGSNVTVGGTATVAANTCRLFTVSVNAAGTAMTFTGQAIGFTGNV